MSSSPSPLHERPAARRFPIGAVLWATVLTLGFGSILSYQMRAGPAATAGETWPGTARLPFDRHRSNLVLFAHPHCPCSAASLEELKIVLTEAEGKIYPTICFFAPPGVPADWTETKLMRAARAIPGMNVVVDRDGSITEKFGAMTSGQVLLFDAQGRRLFAGGITGARGHAGWNRGRAWLVALARGEACVPEGIPVFGCALHDRAAAEEPAL
jgi:hypothetical protein